MPQMQPGYGDCSGQLTAVSFFERYIRFFECIANSPTNRSAYFFATEITENTEG